MIILDIPKCNDHIGYGKCTFMRSAMTTDVPTQVYIAQLHRRAVLLDRRFKDKVIEAFNFDASESYCDKPSPRPTVVHEPAADAPAVYESSDPSGREETFCHESRSQTSMSVSGMRPVAFMRQGKVTHAELVCANVKRPDRMREKLARYEPPYPGSQWPLTAHITDPVRLSVVCQGPSDVMQVSSISLLSCCNPLLRLLPPSPCTPF